MMSRNLPFAQTNPKDAGSVAVIESPAFAYFSRDAAQQAFAASWDAMQKVYQLAFQQAVASLLPKRSVLELRPSVN